MLTLLAALVSLPAMADSPSMKCYTGDELVHAAYNRDLAQMRECLEDGVDINYQGNDNLHPGVTALMWSTYWGDEKGMRLLLEKRADPNVRDGHGDTALEWGHELSGASEKIDRLLHGAGARPEFSSKLAAKGCLSGERNSEALCKDLALYATRYAICEPHFCAVSLSSPFRENVGGRAFEEWTEFLNIALKVNDVPPVHFSPKDLVPFYPSCAAGPDCAKPATVEEFADLLAAKLTSKHRR